MGKGLGEAGGGGWEAGRGQSGGSGWKTEALSSLKEDLACESQGLNRQPANPTQTSPSCLLNLYSVIL